jgi:hypothetical protein
MPAFKQLTDLTQEPDYRNELKVAFKSCNGKKFHYFAKHPKCPKRRHTLVVDGDPGILKMFGGTAKAEGKVFVQPGEGDKELLRFEIAKGAMRLRPLKKYVETFYKTREILVPADEPEEGEDEGAAEEMTGVPQPMPPLPEPPKEPAPTPPKPPLAPPTQAEDPARVKQAAELRLRLAALSKQPVDGPYEQMKKQVIDKADALIAAGRFPEATLLMDQYVKRVATPITPHPPVAPKPEAPPKGPAPSPKLSAYMGAARAWKDAKTAAANGVFALKTAILKEADPELKKAVEAKINELNSILTVMDDGIVAKIQEAGNEADEERQIERNQTIVKVATGIREAIQKHPHAEVVDQNPFGTFAIRQPVDAVLAKFVSDFGG